VAVRRSCRGHYVEAPRVREGASAENLSTARTAPADPTAFAGKEIANGARSRRGPCCRRGGVVGHDDAEPRWPLAACQDIGLMFSNNGPHLVQHGDELAACRLGVAIDAGHHVRGMDRNLHSALLHLANRAGDGPFDFTGHDG